MTRCRTALYVVLLPIGLARFQCFQHQVVIAAEVHETHEQTHQIGVVIQIGDAPSLVRVELAFYRIKRFVAVMIDSLNHQLDLI